MPERTLSQQARDEILKRIILIAPETDRHDLLVDLAEAYALAMGNVTSRRAEVTVNK